MAPSTPVPPPPPHRDPPQDPLRGPWRPAMRTALSEAARAPDTGDVPVGAVVLGPDGSVLGRGRNEREATGDPTAHAEVLALRAAAGTRGAWRLGGCTLVVTLEPCTMCAGALVLARVDRVVYGARDPKAGAAGSLWDVVRDRRLNHRPEVVPGVLAAECGALLTDFFRGRPDTDFGPRRGVG
ncbi:tRNA adenosine(34) deaminase TadA [Streptomyces sp. TRM 70351]|uniref:tRNA adenosine(34) deaminase TadA n=1 Tax=Streptomyces sp. TRM 70351 TaxID=3116552 RepID=UPI002E7BCEB6|nr:tRNA adenosine(34) deaminase TadA [Streptomyces sp. TRM 70351]MEE1929790.1 tRNA adenosine(34) deaminase TadA [Streptomyces sp. TRM 70351]